MMTAILRKKRKKKKKKKKDSDNDKEESEKTKKKKKKKKKDKSSSSGDDDNQDERKVTAENSLSHVIYDFKSSGELNKPHLIQQDSFGIVEKTITKLGTGRKPIKGQEIVTHTTGYLQAGMKKFWSTKDKYEKPHAFRVGLGRVIRGWDLAVLSMIQGEKARFIISGNYGYGMKGFVAWGIPSMAILIFDIELLEVRDDVHIQTATELMKQKNCK